MSHQNRMKRSMSGSMSIHELASFAFICTFVYIEYKLAGCKYEIYSCSVAVGKENSVLLTTAFPSGTSIEKVLLRCSWFCIVSCVGQRNTATDIDCGDGYGSIYIFI